MNKYFLGETIKFIREAGIKIWMLTGDKVETAETIGHSSGLLDDEKKMRKFNIVQIDSQEIEVCLDSIEREIMEVRA